MMVSRRFLASARIRGRSLNVFTNCSTDLPGGMSAAQPPRKRWICWSSNSATSSGWSLQSANSLLNTASAAGRPLASRRLLQQILDLPHDAITKIFVDLVEAIEKKHHVALGQSCGKETAGGGKAHALQRQLQMAAQIRSGSVSRCNSSRMGMG